MSLTFRALPTWPYPEQDPQPDRFKATYTKTLRLLEREIALIDARDPIVGVVVPPSHLRTDGGGFKADARVAAPGAEVSFDIPEGRGWRRVTFHTDVHRTYNYRDSFESNLRAIALGLEALRLVERYGIASSGQQYAGFAQITAGDSPIERGRKLVEKYGDINEALRRTHPDTGADGNVLDFQGVIAYRGATPS
jgi:hypothetical protein